MKYIGIRGHRGSGKQSFAQLLSTAISLILKSNRGEEDGMREEYDQVYSQWCEDIMDGESIVDYASDRVAVDAFGDMPKTFVHLLVGMMDGMDLDDGEFKDTNFINLRTFDIEKGKEGEAVSAEEMFSRIDPSLPPQQMRRDTWMSVREFILYFGREVMQRYFGLNVWIKVMNKNAALLGEFDSRDDNRFTRYKIYRDVKTRSEVSYIKDHGGYIVKLERPRHLRRGKGVDDLSGDNRIDYTVNMGERLEDIREEVWRVAVDIVKRVRGEKFGQLDKEKTED